MKIKRYPGKVVDASLSLDATNVMDVLYEANWQNFTSSARNANDSGDLSKNNAHQWNGASTLGKYQMTLEQVRERERQATDDRIVWAIKDLNGYKPSTLRRKPRNFNCDWDVSKDNNSNNSSNHYVADPTESRLPRPRQQMSLQPPVLKRAQTMAARPPPTHNGSTLDIKDLRKQWRTERSLKAKSQDITTATPTLPVPHNCDSINNGHLNGQPVPKPRTLAGAKKRIPPTPPPRTVTLIGKEQLVSKSMVEKLQNEEMNRIVDIEPLRETFAEMAFSRDPKKIRRQLDSASSAYSTSHSSSADSDQFSIPRPRLIVPVHTYARKRKTGNLQDQDVEVASTNNEDNTKNVHGKRGKTS